MIINRTEKFMSGALTIEERGHHGGMTSVAVIRGRHEFTARGRFNKIVRAANIDAETAGTASVLFERLKTFFG